MILLKSSTSIRPALRPRPVTTGQTGHRRLQTELGSICRWVGCPQGRPGLTDTDASTRIQFRIFARGTSSNSNGTRSNCMVTLRVARAFVASQTFWGSVPLTFQPAGSTQRSHRTESGRNARCTRRLSNAWQQ